MGLPKITFNIAKDGLNQTTGAIQKIAGLVITGVTVPDLIAIGESTQIFSLDDAIKKGITKEGDNAFAYKHIRDFYELAGTGVELWIMLVSDGTTYEKMADQTEDIAKKLIADSKGRIRVLGLVKKAGESETIEKGLDADVKKGIINLQKLAEYYQEKYMPFRAVISGNKFSGEVGELEDFTEAEFNKVMLLISNNDGKLEASVGLALGRLASIPSQRSIARVKDGAVEFLKGCFTNGKPVESLVDAWDAIHDLGYTFFRIFAGRSGYYFSDDQTLTKPTDDFKSLARGFVMDEAVLIAYNVLVEELSDEIQMTEFGQIHPAILKSWQTNVENNLNQLMTNEGKLSAVKVFIDTLQNILATNELIVVIQLLPVGYAKYIEVNIGFTTKIE